MKEKTILLFKTLDFAPSTIIFALIATISSAEELIFLEAQFQDMQSVLGALYGGTNNELNWLNEIERVHESFMLVIVLLFYF